MDQIQPRFEFRVWDQELSGPAGRLQGLASPTATLKSDEIYIVAEGCDDTNTKLRDDMLDVKVLQRVVERCEQWQPWIKAELPVPATLLTQELLPRLGVVDLPVERDLDSSDALIGLLSGHPQIWVARVSKQRTKYLVSACLAETAIVAIERRQMQTVAIESTDLAALCDLRRRLGLETYENVSYPRAVKLTLLPTSDESESEDGH